MTYEVVVSAEGDHVIVSLLGATLDTQTWNPHTERYYWGTRPATWTVSPPSPFAKLFGSTLSSKVTRAIGKAVSMKARLVCQDEQARLACAEATRVAESALSRKILPEHPWPPPPPSSTGYAPESTVHEVTQPQPAQP